MPQEQPAVSADAGIDDREETLTVIGWAAQNDRPTGRLGRGWGALRADPRLAPLLAVLAGLALFGSLLTEWRVWTIVENSDAIGGFGRQRLVSSVISFPGVGNAYLIGLLVLAACVTLVLRGTEPVRRNARLVGLATTGVLLAVLVTVTAQVDQVGGVVEDIALPDSGDGAAFQSTIEYGRGIYLAFAGVGIMGLALWWVTPVERRVSGVSSAEPDETDESLDSESNGDGGLEAAGWGSSGGAGWPWRSRAAKRSTSTHTQPSRPVDITVEPAAPFLPPGDQTGPR